jgi:hypothetical protein
MMLRLGMNTSALRALCRPDFGRRNLTNRKTYLERMARELRARAADCLNPIVAASWRRRAEDFQLRANAATASE